MKIQRLGADWNTILNVCRTTQNKCAIEKEPSEEFKKKITRSRHSPIRLIEFLITGELQGFVLTHISRHKHQLIFIGTGRTDLTNKSERPLDTELRPFNLYINADAFITLYEARSCFKASLETRNAVEEFKELVSTVEPLVSNHCFKPCEKYGRCNEFEPCGYMNTNLYQINRQIYLGV